MLFFLFTNHLDLISINAKNIKLSMKGRSRTNQERDEYPFLHMRSNIKVQNKI
jgi:hypothetical protein